VALADMRCDPSVQLSGGKSHGTAGGVPCVIVNTVGQGKAVLLNFSMAAFPCLWTKGSPEAAADFLGKVLALADVRPVFTVLDGKGKRVRNLELTRWQNQRIQIISLSRPGGVKETAHIQMPGSWHVYDLRSGGKHLAPARSVAVPILPNRASFLVLTPQPVPTLGLKLSATTVSRGQVMRLSVSAPGAAGLHAVRVRVKTPQQQEAGWLDRELMVDANGQTCELPVAHNDPVGTWLVRATDLYTSQTYTTQYTVK